MAGAVKVAPLCRSDRGRGGGWAGTQAAAAWGGEGTCWRQGVTADRTTRHVGATSDRLLYASHDMLLHKMRGVKWQAGGQVKFDPSILVLCRVYHGPLSRLCLVVRAGVGGNDAKEPLYRVPYVVTLSVAEGCP